MQNACWQQPTSRPTQPRGPMCGCSGTLAAARPSPVLTSPPPFLRALGCRRRGRPAPGVCLHATLFLRLRPLGWRGSASWNGGRAGPASYRHGPRAEGRPLRHRGGDRLALNWRAGSSTTDGASNACWALRLAAAGRAAHRWEGCRRCAGARPRGARPGGVGWGVATGSGIQEQQTVVWRR